MKVEVEIKTQLTVEFDENSKEFLELYKKYWSKDTENIKDKDYRYFAESMAEKLMLGNVDNFYQFIELDAGGNETGCLKINGEAVGYSEDEEIPNSPINFIIPQFDRGGSDVFLHWDTDSYIIEE